MWKDVRRYAFNAWLKEDECHYDEASTIFEAWLFSLTTDNEPRVMVLLSEWLALPETREKWGLEECEACGGQGFYCIGNPNDEETWCCEKCDGRCKVKAEWAKEAEHENNQG